MRLAVVIGVCVLGVLAVLLVPDLSWLARWAVEQQRAFQNEMAGAVRALRTGSPGATAALLLAAGAYGFVHAVGPGHGKYLIGGVGVGSGVSMARLLGIAIVSSLAQAAWAILLVYGGFAVLEVSARSVTTLAEDYLAPASYLVIALIGVVLVWRGLRGFARQANAGHAHTTSDGGHDHHHHAEGEASCACCGHAHGPTPEEVAALGSMRDTLVLVGSIAVRPCTGAIFLLVIAWQMDIRAAGAAAVIVMGLGTATLTSLVAVSSIVARGLGHASVSRFGAASRIGPALQILAGGFVVWMSLVMLGYAVG
ncbi:nickel/cobalt transporter [Psychromarinibacter sp. S121]|uniref:nickel/cobalt transporter n=1 Tax=Psychromarinibacter sp. S121 TaxID=3415127 RepID=UPI003C7BBB97